MKTSIFLRTIILFFCIALMGCSKEDTDNNNATIYYGTMEAQVSGLLTIADNTVIDFEPHAIRTVDDEIYITGGIWSRNTAQLSISILGTINIPGTYTENVLASISEGWSCSPNYAGGQTCWYKYLHNSTEGSVTITEINEQHISGFFQFTCNGVIAPEVYITDGYFDILRE